MGPGHLLGVGAAEVAQEVRCVDRRHGRVVTHRLRRDLDPREEVGTLEQPQRQLRVGTGDEGHGNVGGAAPAHRSSRGARGPAELGAPPELLDGQVQGVRHAGHQRAAAVGGVGEHLARHRDHGLGRVVDEWGAVAVEDPAADRRLAHGAGVHGRGGTRVVLVLADLDLAEPPEEGAHEAEGDQPEDPHPAEVLVRPADRSHPSHADGPGPDHAGTPVPWSRATGDPHAVRPEARRRSALTSSGDDEGAQGGGQHERAGHTRQRDRRPRGHRDRHAAPGEQGGGGCADGGHPPPRHQALPAAGAGEQPARGIGEGAGAEHRRTGRHQVDHPPGSKSQQQATGRAREQRAGDDDGEHEVGQQDRGPRPEGGQGEGRHDDEQRAQHDGRRAHPAVPAPAPAPAGPVAVPVAGARGVVQAVPTRTPTTSRAARSAAGVTEAPGTSWAGSVSTSATVPTRRPGRERSAVEAAQGGDGVATGQATALHGAEVELSGRASARCPARRCQRTPGRRTVPPGRRRSGRPRRGAARRRSTATPTPRVPRARLR